MDVNNNIIRTIFSVLNPVFFGNAANVGIRCSVLNGESADVPEDIVVEFTRGLQRLHPESHFQCGRYCYALP